MKKIFLTIVCLGIIFITFINVSTVKGNSINDTSVSESIEKKLIRFHVIANSDTVEDQALKLKVRDKVLQYISPKLKNSKSIDESRKIIKDNSETIKKLAEKVIKENGYKYSVETKLSKEKFPVKTYGNITLPQGEYEAFKIIIGNGSGQNWWCVMFPPLCFIDITKGEVSYKETEEAMKKVLSEKEYEAVDNTLEGKEEKKAETNENKIIIKFKIVEIIKDLFKK
ncbi:stage II sporulation protein R [Clostridium sp. SYSU_GA19001]|uniref:stage II sporulation protein R n=1 Tax=Clostridium caldaquaticum TaxID=2940653 RepID=UPI00207712E5|nr:stage II sporulation protein R [Clostridium caldaquaticum]MCM8709710.1 stage II sporulation protein R [Clostridium caldaquaticum]